MTTWTGRSSPATTWGARSSPSTSWTDSSGRITGFYLIDVDGNYIVDVDGNFIIVIGEGSGLEPLNTWTGRTIPS